MKKNISKISFAAFALTITLLGLSTFANTVTAATNKAPRHVVIHNTKNAPHLGVRGKVTAISGTTISITSGSKKNPTTTTIDASKAKVQGEKTHHVSDIKVGDTIVVIGTSQSGTVTATMITVRPEHTVTAKK